MKKLLASLLLVSIASFSQVTPTNVWNTTGNTFQTNVNYLGTNNNTSFSLKTNGVKRFKIDSIGVATLTGTLSATNFSVSGTAGAGYLFLKAQSATVTPSPNPGVSIYSNASGNFMWTRKPNIGSDVYARTFIGNNTANRSYTLKDADGTLAFTSDITSYTATAPLSLNSGTFSMAAATGTNNGYLASSDYNLFAGLLPTSVQTSNYSASANDLVNCDATSGTFTVTLPTAPANKSTVAIKLGVNPSNLNSVVVLTGGSDVINRAGGPTTFSIMLQNDTYTMEYYAGIWYVINNSHSVASLDTRYESLSNKTGTISVSSTLYPNNSAVINYVTGLNYLTGASAASTYVPLTRSLTINGQALDLSANRTYTTGDALIANTLSQFSPTTSAAFSNALSDETGTGSVVFSTGPTLTGTTTVGTLSITGTSFISDGLTLNTGTVTGMRIGGSTTQKLSFFNATPVVLPAATLDLGVALSNLGLRGVGTAYPITTSGSLAFSGAAVFSSATNTQFTNQGITFNTAGKGITFKTGTAQAIGTTTFVAGSAVVTNSNVAAANCVITPVITGTNAAASAIINYGAGTFTITSSNITDTREVRYTIFYFN